MKYNLSFHKKAWEEYLYWQSQDKKTLKKINSIIESICRGNLVSKSEKLKANKCISVRINEKDRLIYRLESNNIQIIQLKGHYNDK